MKPEYDWAYKTVRPFPSLHELRLYDSCAQVPQQTCGGRSVVWNRCWLYYFHSLFQHLIPSTHTEERCLVEALLSISLPITDLQRRILTVWSWSFLFLRISSINAYLLAWEKLGNKGWNWNLLKTYYAKTEKFISPQILTDLMSRDLENHGSEGAHIPLLVVM